MSIKENRSKCRLVVLLAGCVFIVCACVIKPSPSNSQSGKWVSLEVPAIIFSAVKINAAATDSAYQNVCIEAQNEITKQLIIQMPEQLKPVVFQVSTPQNKRSISDALLQVEITKCEVDVDQSGGMFEFYLTLQVDVTLKKNNAILMTLPIHSFERVQIDDPSPTFEFSYEESVQRILGLFDSGRVLMVD